MADYQIRVLNPDGHISLLYLASFIDDEQAKMEARGITREGKALEIWRGRRKIEEIPANPDPT